MFELFALALFQFGVLFGSPETINNQQTSPQYIDGDTGGAGWGDGHVTGDSDTGGAGWGDGHVNVDGDTGGAGWGDGH
jgi:hypothetical protein